jgi:hypothetical protein
MRVQQPWWSGLVAAALVGLVGVTAVAAAGAQFLPVLSIREGATRSLQIPRTDGYIAYLTLINERDGGINGVPLVWEECESVYDVTRTVECYERLKAKGPTGAAEGLISPLTLSCRDHEGGASVKFQQSDGKQWTVITDWIATDQALVRPLVEASAAKYAQEKGITPRDCP